MHKAAQRREAERSLNNLQTTLAAVGACWSKEGQCNLDKVRNALLGQLK